MAIVHNLPSGAANVNGRRAFAGEGAPSSSSPHTGWNKPVFQGQRADGTQTQQGGPQGQMTKPSAPSPGRSGTSRQLPVVQPVRNGMRAT